MERVRFYYDVVCPYSYMESRAVETAEEEGRAEVEWLPFELRPAPRPLLEVRGDHLRVDWTRYVYARAQGSVWRSTCRGTNPAPPCRWRHACGPRRRDG